MSTIDLVILGTIAALAVGLLLSVIWAIHRPEPKDINALSWLERRALRAAQQDEEEARRRYRESVKRGKP